MSLKEANRRLCAEYDYMIGQRLRELREERGVTQQELAEAVGVTFQQIQKYERGVNRISAGKLLRLIRYLHVKCDQFLSSCLDLNGSPYGNDDNTN